MVEAAAATVSAEHSQKRRRLDHMMRVDGESSNINGDSQSFLNGSAVALSNAGIPKTTNGSYKESTMLKGTTTSNGHFQGTAKGAALTYFGHDREEVSRILIQALLDLGYDAAARKLIQESGYELESPVVAAFRDAVLQGKWAQAEALLFGQHGRSSVDDTETEVEPSNGHSDGGLVLAENANPDIMRFWLRQQKFLELLEAQETSQALVVLRTELTPVHHDTHKLHFLSSLLMCHSKEELMKKASWDGAHGDSRHHLLSELSRCLSPSVMIPEHRLAVLLDQVKKAQVANCFYHNTIKSPSLYCDHRCDRENFPLKVEVELQGHTGEVWFIEFSHDGSRLASCDADGKVLIWDLQTLKVLQTLSMQEGNTSGSRGEGVCSAAWSPDDKYIVSCSMDNRARLWNSETGQLLRTIIKFEEPVSRCAWAPNGETFVTGCLYKERNLCQWDRGGNLVYDWGRSHRIQDLALSADGQLLVAMDNDNHLHVYNFITRELEYEIDLKVGLTSISISKDSKQLLVGKVDGEARLFDVDSRESVKTYVGPKMGEFVIRSSFGGANENFVISGSEDGHVFIWHRENAALVERLEAHGPGCCSAIAWNPVNPCMFATGGDDRKVKLWSSKPIPKSGSNF